MRAVRALSGTIAAGTVLLALVVIGAAFIGARRGFPGPGAESVTWHIAVAIVVVGAQTLTDRRRGITALSGSAVVFLACGLLIWTQWWG
ncbi:MAG TPA: hypothetical protein VK083_05655 [Nocardia sp.]|uniref:hypothetical protein n=1 Tax=Nocardia sp. TaxID=1821 RepID=UPI002B4B035D|nr:hypothetical protein [Nocardia sp.]HLS76255.1 hypothetical protein [Nocardia sp.]